MTLIPHRAKPSGALPPLDVHIQTLDAAKNACGVTSAKVAFSSVCTLLATNREYMINEQDYVELGLLCVDVCKALERGLDGRRLGDLSCSMLGAINRLTIIAEAIQKEIVRQGGLNVASRFFCTRGSKDLTATWRQDLNEILQLIDAELLIDSHMIIWDLRNDALSGQESANPRDQSARDSASLGELPPPPGPCFGRDELINGIVCLAENFEPIALIGAGGIGKTSVALSVLHHDRIKDRFGDNRRFIRCNRFPTSRAHFLGRLSEAVGAGIEHPEDLAPLRPFLSSRKMILFLDNVESILDRHGTDAQETYDVLEELSRFSNICLAVTSRIPAVPPHFKCPIISTLPMQSACEIFHGIHNCPRRPDVVGDIVRQLDFHPLSITLLATTASYNAWDYGQLAEEWKAHGTKALRTGYYKNLAAAMEFSLTSRTFQTLDPSARDLLGVIAFFPQGVDEKCFDRLFPAVADRKNIIDKFCALSLTYRNNGFITMLAPIRDYLGPQDPKSSPLLCTAKDHYFTRLSVFLDPDMPEFGEARWITSEDVNVEYLLNAFVSLDTIADDVLEACINFMRHLYWHKPRQTILRSKIEGLPDNHPAKPRCLFQLSRLFQSVGNHAEQKRLLIHTLKLEREQRNDAEVAQALRHLSDVNRLLDLHKEGARQGEEALEIYQRLGDMIGQASCLNNLAWLFLGDGRLGAAEDAASRTIDSIPEKGQEFLACESYRVLGGIYHSRGDREEAIHHLKVALGIALPFDWRIQLFWIHYSLAGLFLDENGFDDAHVHVEKARSNATEDTYRLGRAIEVQARIYHRQRRFEDAMSEALRALDIFEKLGAAEDVENCRGLVRKIKRGTKGWSTGIQRWWYNFRTLDK